MPTATERLLASMPGHAEPGHAAAPAFHAFRMLHLLFVALPLIAGLDKFAHLLADWIVYLSPAVPDALGIDPELFMRIVGGIEIGAALTALIVPAIGGWLIAGWLCLVIVDLLILGGHGDVVLRDAGLAVAAVAFARLATAHGEHAAPAAPAQD